MAPSKPVQVVDPGSKLFRSRVRYVLIHHCLHCHNTESREGGLDLSTREGLMEGGENGAVVDTRDVKGSRLYRLIAHQTKPYMPKDEPRLNPADIQVLARWLEAGFPYQEPLTAEIGTQRPREITEQDRQFWSFRPLDLKLPEVLTQAATSLQRSWSQQPVDRYILARLQQAGLPPAAHGGRLQLLRRGMLDLLGLPPSVLEQERVSGRDTPDSWSRVVDQMLASPHYGERWGRHWLDVVRFAESYGFEHDLDNPNAFHYRDFVVRSLNQGLPFDQFVRWQIAGDELAPDEPLARMATGFLAAGVRNADIAKVRVEQERYDELDDMASTIGNAMLGLSLGCARCHDHKFDPLRQEDYYRFVATFERTIRGETEMSIWPGEPPVTVLVAGEGLKPLARIYNPPPAFYEQTWFLRRGDARLKDHVVLPALPKVLTQPGTSLKDWAQRPSGSSGSTFRRTRLARWMTDVQQGAGILLARVMVNRLWQYHFGRGVVATPNDFGKRGAPPTHPYLLDQLAHELILGDWDLKRLHRQILCSATWQQDVLRRPRTPRDDQLFRGHKVRRLEAEIVRDQMLAVSDTFNRRMFGEGTLDEQQPRRSIYFRVKRSQQIPFLGVFDAPDTLQSTPVRVSTTVAPQALAMMNSRTVRQLAESFARRLSCRDQGLPEVLAFAYAEALGRRPTDAELLDATGFVTSQQAEYSQQKPRVMGPPAQDAIVLWLDATQVGGETGKAIPLARWTGRATTSSVRASVGHVPRWEPTATTLKQPAVKFGPMPTVMRMTSQEALQFGTADFTISVLFRVDPAAGDDNQILGKDSFSGGNSYTGFFFQHRNEQLRFSTRDLKAGKGPVNYLDSMSRLRKGAWHCATGLRRAGVLSLFLGDGEDADTTMREAAETNVNNPLDFKIGEMDEAMSGALNGEIAEVLAFDRALRPAEVYQAHQYLQQKYLVGDDVVPLEKALADFCQALFCLNEFIYVE
ncbi:MAG: DUF1549 domain-containing protein [Planctomycetota bacterium]|nr:DUF1549 domain-containing protein [Planctomycetota bacterium]